MRWVIKNPAPTDSRLKKWGDYHFGRAISKYLERAGHEVVSHYHSEWENRASEPADVVLLLRGKYALHEAARHENALHVMWNISHPAAVSSEEYASYDLILVASESWAKSLNERLGRTVHPFLQCTDVEEFFEAEDNDPYQRNGCVFVGNTRDAERLSVLSAVEYGLPVQIYGRGWSSHGLSRQVVADYIDNERLGALYARSRFTLNDHWHDMREFGFINNRIFDALACGLPVISDAHDALQTHFQNEILYFDSAETFHSCVETMILAYPVALRRTRSGGDLVRSNFSFANRVNSLLKLVTAQRSLIPR